MPQTIFPGLRFGRLRVLEYSHFEYGGPCPTRKRWKRHYWKCLCECGNETVSGANGLRNGDIQSCGCLQRELASIKNTKHGACRGYKKTREWKIWNGILRRCYDTKVKSYEKYGKRGIRVCRGWYAYLNFLQDLGASPGPKYSVDRINGDGGYTCGKCKECVAMKWPLNCRWATPMEQAANRKTARILKYDNRQQCIAAWAREIGVSSNTIRARLDIYGWPVEKALSEPVHRRVV